MAVTKLANRARIDEGVRKLELSIWVKAQPERVFKALTDAKDLNSWFLGHSSTDPRPGGKFHICWNREEFGACESEFIDVIPHEKVSFYWFKKSEIVTFTLRPENGGTLVTLVHDGFAIDAKLVDRYADHGIGWTGYLCNLKCYLERDWDLREGAPAGTLPY